MNTERHLLTELQDFLLGVMHDATATPHHDIAGRLYSRVHLLVTRPRPHQQHFTAWRASSENSVRDNPKAEVMVYMGLFPGRTHDLMLELLT